MKNLGFLLIGMFTVGSSAFMMAGLLPQIGETLDVPLSLAAQGITVFSLTYLFSAPVFSIFPLIDSQKSRLIVALLIFLAGNLFTVFADQYFLFIIGRILAGLGAGIFNPLAVEVVLQGTSKKRRGKKLSLIWGANSAGVVFGVPIGVYVSENFAWQYSIGLVITLSTIVLIGFSLVLKTTKTKNTQKASDRLKLLTNKSVLATLLVTTLTCFIATGLYSYISFIAALSPHSLAQIVLFWGVGGVVGSSLVGGFVDRTNSPRGVMAFLLFILALNFVTLPFFVGIEFIGLLPFFIWGAMGWATVTPQQYALFEISESMGGTLSALNSSAIGLGGSLGTAIGGLVIGLGVNQDFLLTFAGVFLFALFMVQLGFVKFDLFGVRSEKNYSHS